MKTIFAIMAVLLAGCAAPPGPTFHRAELNKGDFDRDMRECQFQGANAVGWRIDDNGKMIVPCFSWGCFRDDIQSTFKTSESIKMSCMKSRGYTITRPVNSSETE